MSFGTGEFGSSLSFGGITYEGDGPFLLSAYPGPGDTAVAQDTSYTLVVDSANVVDPMFIDISVLGRQAIVGGLFQAGWAGSILQDGSSVVISITSSPLIESSPTYVEIRALDGLGVQAVITYEFYTSVGEVTNLLAKSWCEGKRIDLTWTNPASATRIRVLRSRNAYATPESEAGTPVYDGVPVASLSDTGLQENCFYYYTVLLSYSAAAPYRYVVSSSAQVEGLSIKDYQKLHEDAGVPEGRYVYSLLPRTYRERDADPNRGDDQYLLRKYCDVLQCAVNLYRGWAEGLEHLKDPDTMPAGRLGEADNQLGILSAYVKELGGSPEKSFDAGVLRRLVMGIVSVNKKKGTCAGLIEIAKILTTWDTTCSEAIEPVCGINRLFTLWDGESSIEFS